MNNQMISDMKQWDWQTIIDYANSLGDFNDAQWRFLKGLIIEKTVEKHSNDRTLKYVGEVHKDYIWSRHSVDVELKSNMTGSMYTKKAQLRTSFTIKLNNSMGTNTKALNAQNVADIIIVPMSDGVWAIDRDTVMANHNLLGDGVVVKVTKDMIVPLTGMITRRTQFAHTLKQDIVDTITRSVPR